MIFEPPMLMAHTLLPPVTVPDTSMKLWMVRLVHATYVCVQSVTSPEFSPGARQLVKRMLTGPHGKSSPLIGSSVIVILHKVAWPVLVTTAYQVTTLVSIPLPQGLSLADGRGVLPLSDTSLAQAMLAGTTKAIALVVAVTDAPLAATPAH